MDGSVESPSMAFFSPHCLGLKGPSGINTDQAIFVSYPTDGVRQLHIQTQASGLGNAIVGVLHPACFSYRYDIPLHLISLSIQPEDISLMGFTLHVKANVKFVCQM
jgi:hypothetical protein